MYRFRQSFNGFGISALFGLGRFSFLTSLLVFFASLFFALALQAQVTPEPPAASNNIFLPIVGNAGFLGPAPVETPTPPPTLSPTPGPSPTPTPTLAPPANIAVSRPVTQSSTASGAAAERAIDGDQNGDFGAGSVSLTETELNPWWQIDFEEMHRLESVSIWNRSDCCSANLADLYLFVSPTDMTGRPFAALRDDPLVQQIYHAGPVGAQLTLPADLSGRYLRIQLGGSQESALALAEVEVVGRPFAPDEALLHITGVEPGARVLETGGQPARFTVTRYGQLIEQRYPLSVLHDAGRQASSVSDSMLTLLDIEQGTIRLAGPEDYVLRDGGNVPVDPPLGLLFTSGQQSQEMTLEAVADTVLEVPEFLRLEFIEEPRTHILYENEMNLLIADGEPTLSAESPLFVALLSAEGDAVTAATGVGTVRLAGDNSYGLVSLNFSGLTSLQTAAHIHIANPESGPIAVSLPNGQFTDERWDVEAAHHLTTDQEMLDALVAGGLYINVHSGDYPAGEIRGTLQRSQGYIEGQEPNFNYPAPPIEALSGEALRRDIVRFLTQATFGPTPADVAAMEARIAAKNGDRIAAYSEWIDAQIALQAPSELEYYKAYYSHTIDPNPNAAVQSGHFGLRDSSSFLAGVQGHVYSQAQLRQRVGFALSEIYVVSVYDPILNDYRWGIVHFNDILKRNAFGKFETLLTDVSKSPAMGFYLSHYVNQAEQLDENGVVIASPDENYAREVMQLFSIGLVERYPDYSLKLDQSGIPLRTYTQADINELARVFTGWAFAVTSTDMGRVPDFVENEDFFGGFSFATTFYHPEFVTPMKNFADNGLDPSDPDYVRYHDNGEKRVLGTTIPAGQTGEEDLAQVMGMLSEHPNTGPFISYQLIQRLVTSNPSAGYVYRVATVFDQTDGDLGEVVRAILLDPEARNLTELEKVGHGKVKEPYISYISNLRLYQARSSVAGQFPFETLLDFGLTQAEYDLYEPESNWLFARRTYMTEDDKITEVSQTPNSARTVFNWFLPDYTPPGPIAQAGLVAPELQLYSESVVVSYFNLMQDLFVGEGGSAYGPQYRFGSTKTVVDVPAWLSDPYTAVLDTNGDGALTSADGSLTDAALIRQASAAVVDEIDFYLCAGHLFTNRTGDPETDPREVIIDGVVATLKAFDTGSAADAEFARDERIREAMLFIGSAPQCMVQR